MQPLQHGFVIGIQAFGAGEVEIEIVERGGFHGGRVGFQDAADALGKFGVVLVLAGNDNRLGANAQRVAEAHGGFHTAEFGFVAGGGHHAAAHQHGLAAQLRVQHLLDGSEEGVHIHVDNVRRFLCRARFAQPQPAGREPRAPFVRASHCFQGGHGFRACGKTLLFRRLGLQPQRAAAITNGL